MKIVPLGDFENIWYIDSFAKEFQHLFGKSKKEANDYLEVLFRDLELLDKFDIAELRQFEPLVGEDDLYSIRLMGRANCRVLYTCTMIGNKIILLFPFLEKSKSDYEKAIRRARPIVKSILGGNYDE